MTTLFSYCIPYDDGAAPNPFWGVCTLAICKPRIRQAANVGDWIVGTGSKNSPIGDVSNKVVYAMFVTQKMTMEDYDRFTKSELRRNIRKWKAKVSADASATLSTISQNILRVFAQVCIMRRIEPLT